MFMGEATHSGKDGGRPEELEAQELGEVRKPAGATKVVDNLARVE